VTRARGPDASFRIPAALAPDGRLVVPASASRGTKYRCPECCGPVDLHAGAKKRRHFHHRAGACTAESIVHLTAKRLVVQAVSEWRAGGPRVVFVRGCAHEGCEAKTEQGIPAKVSAAAEERALPSGHVVDVALLARGLELPIAAIEIVHTHAVDAVKAFELGIPWVEAEAAQVCADAGGRVVVTRDRFVPWLCAEHAGSRGRALKATREERATAAALVRRLPFALTDYPGYRIEAAARCENGHDALVFGWEGKEPPWPRPPLVVAVASDEDWGFRSGDPKPRRLLAFRRAYASVCAICAGRVEARAKPTRRKE